MFDSDKNSKELGIDTTRKFVLVQDNPPLLKGDVVVLLEDDTSPFPFFKKEGENGRKHCVHWSYLEYFEEKGEEKVETTVDPTLKDSEISLEEKSKKLLDENQEKLKVKRIANLLVKIKENEQDNEGYRNIIEEIKNADYLRPARGEEL